MRLLVLWSAPRCRSTAFERMMRERGDFTILHEPFSHLTDYGSATVDGQVLTTQPQLLAALNRTPGPAFLKDTTDFHYPGVLTDRQFLGGATHTFIIRHPREAIESHFALNPKLGRDEIGFAWLYEIFAAVRDTTGATPVVVDSDDLMRDPASTIERYCEAVGIPFLPGALQWSPGMASGWERSERWHKDTSSSNGFELRQRRHETSVNGSPQLAEYLAYHLPYYERLREHRLKVS